MAEEKTFAASLGIEAFTAEELGYTLSGDYDEIPEDEMAEYQAIEKNIKNAAAARIVANVQRATAEGLRPEEGPVIGGYEYVDIFCMSPRKRDLSPPFITLPHKLVAAGERIFHRALLLINPLPGPMGTPSGTMVLGAHPVRVSFSLMNVTTATAGPTAAWNGIAPGLAPTLTLLRWPITHADPGPNPHIFELNVTFDCLDPAQPWAAFATQWWDGDTDPGWPWWLPGPTIPTVPPWLRRVQIPLRYMVFRK